MTARLQIRRILCPTDFSEPSRIAFEHAVTLARWYEAEITVAHAVPAVLVFPEPAWPATPAPAEITHRTRADLDRWAQPSRDAGIRTDVAVVDGDPVRNILELVQSTSADLLVMGTHGRKGFEAAMLGSVTASVLRKSAAPVLTVSRKSRAAGTPGVPPFRRILCPLDLTAGSAKTLDFALSLAQETNASLTLLHVLDGPGLGALPDPALGAVRGEAWLVADARERLRGAVPAEARDWCDVMELVTTGEASRQILEVAREQRAGLIVMGAHGARPIDVFFFGSTARRVVRDGVCPVLTVRLETHVGASANTRVENHEELSFP